MSDRRNAEEAARELLEVLPLLNRMPESQDL